MDSLVVTFVPYWLPRISKSVMNTAAPVAMPVVIVGEPWSSSRVLSMIWTRVIVRDAERVRKIPWLDMFLTTLRLMRIFERSAAAACT
jgi:hypothetical protein